MTTAAEMQSEYRNLSILNFTEFPRIPVALLTKRRLTNWRSPSEPRACFRRTWFRSKATVMKSQPGRDATAQRNWLDSIPVPVRIVQQTDAQALETSIVENLQWRDVQSPEQA